MGRRGQCALPLLLPLLLFVAAGLSSARDLPAYLKACSETDPKVSECALKSALAALPFLIKGDPSIKLLSSDPLEITEMVVDQSGLKFKMRDVRLLGQKNTVLEDIRMIPGERRIEIDLLWPSLEMTYKFNVSGKILVLSLDGAGTGSMKMENVTVKYKASYEPVSRGNEEYVKVNVYESRGEMGHMSINLQNLFNGDKFLGENTNKVLNDNWRVLVEDIAPAMFESYRLVAQNLVDTILKDVPFRKVFLE